MGDPIFETVSAISERLAALRGRHPEIEPELIADVVRAVIGHAGGVGTGREEAIIGEVEELGRTIASAKAEIAALRVDDINDNHIPSATDELDAIIAHTASATDQILEVCETLDRVATELEGEPASRLQDATTHIYEACSFQDITGQRITKVVATLKTIERKIAQIVATFGTGCSTKHDSPRTGEDTLLNGPQLPAAAMDQSDIDKLLASFD